MVNINKHLQAEMKSCTSCFNCVGDAVVFLCATSRFISFVFYVPLQIYAGLDHVIASQVIVKEPNSLTKLWNSPMTEDSYLEGRWSRLNWGNKSLSIKELFWISLFNNLLLLLDIYTVNELRLQDGSKIMLQSGNLSIDKIIFSILHNTDFVFLVLLELHLCIWQMLSFKGEQQQFVKGPTTFVIYKLCFIWQID